MNNERLEARVRTAVEHTAPDGLDRLMAACDEPNGKVIPTTETETKKRRSRRLPFAAIAAVLALCVGLAGYQGGRAGSAVDSVILLDVNPSLSLSVNAEEVVVEATPLNEDGKVVIGDMKLNGVDLDTAVNALIGSMLRNGYLSEWQNSILVTVEGGDAGRSAQLQERVASAIDSMCQGANMDASVLSQTVTETDVLIQLASQYSISVGKAALIQEVAAQDPTLTVEELAPMTVTEIALISSSRNLTTETVAQTGSASDKAYIGQEAAVAAACRHAGVDQSGLTGVKVEFDSDHGIMVYEVEFWVGTTEYEYDINARTGEVVKFEADQHNSGTHHSNSHHTSTASYIGEAAAQEAALAHAGVTAADAAYLNTYLSYDDGYPEYYEVEFQANSIRYEYEIDLYSGTVLKYEQKQLGGQSGTNSPAVSSQSPATGQIGEDAALTTALNHAGLTRDQVSKLEVKLDYDDDRYEYEIEFEYGRYEYEYKIDASAGTILEYEIDD